MRLKVPWFKVNWSAGTAGSVIALMVALFIVGVLLGLAFVGFLIWVIVINAHDIATVGANFWNIFWIVLAAIGILGTLRGTHD